MKVLVIEDNKADQRLLQEMFRDMNMPAFELVFAENLTKGIAYLDSEDIGIVILDLGLPESQGLDTFLRLKEHAQNVSVIVLTGLDDTGIARNSLKEGAQDYLIKGWISTEILKKSIIYAIERQRLIEELRQSNREILFKEERFRILIEENADAMVVLSKKEGVQYQNPAAELLFKGASADYLKDLSIFPFEGGKSIERTLDFPAGIQKTIEIRGVPIEWERLPAFLLTIHDITERKRAEEEIESLAKFPQENPNPIFRVSNDGILRFANSSAEFLINELRLSVGTKVPEFLEKVLQEAIEGGSRLEQEKMVGGKTYLFTIAPIIGQNYVNLYGLDITGRRNAEEALKKSEALLKRTGDIARVGGWEVDAETLTVMWTEETFHIHELPVDQMPPPLEEAINFFHPDERRKLSDAIKRALTSSEGYDMELRFITATGKPRWTRTVCQPQVVDGKTIRLVGSFQDITERKLAEAALRGSEQRFRELADSITDVFFAMDQDLRYTYWNKASEELTGIPAQDAIGKSIHEIFADTPEIRRAVQVYQDVLKSNQTRSFENEYNFGGKRFYFDISVYPTADGIAVITTDITERKRMEGALLLTRYSIDSTPDTIVTVSQDGLFVDVNEGFCRSSGYSRDELLSMTVHDIDPEFTAEVWLAFWNKLKQSGSLIFETMHRSKEGKNYPVEIIATYFEYNGKEYHCGFAHDITERKLGEKRLQESEKRYRNVVQDQTEFICRFLPDGTHIFANEAYCSYFGKTCDLIINTQFKPSILQQDRQIVKEHFASLTPQHPIATIEHRIVMPDGQIRWQQWNDRAIFDANGNLFEYQSVGRDTTDRNLMEEEILSLNQTLEQRVKERTDDLMHLNEEMLSEIAQRKDMERQLQLTITDKETLLKEIHHRVKNNLQIISSLLNLQSQYIKDEKTLTVIRESQNRIKVMALIHEKIYQSESLDKVDYGDYLEKITRSLFESYGVNPQKIAIKVHAENIALHIDKAIPCSLIINELLANSFKHAFPKDRTGEVRIDVQLDGDTIRLLYSDNGIGLPESVTLERTESLGMRLIAGLTQQLKGTVEIQRGGGTTFLIAFNV